MLRLGLLLYIFIGTTFAGSAMVIALVTGNDTLTPLLVSALVGAVAAMPAAWLVSRSLYQTS